MTEQRRVIDPYQGKAPAYLGKKGEEFRGLDVFPNPGNAIVRMTSDEVTSMCPITGAPDFEVVDVTYAPISQCIESKSFKMYLQELRNVAAFVEALALKIAEDIAGACGPQWVRVDVTQKARGGISIVAVGVLHRTSEGTYEQGRPLVEVGPPRNFYLGH